VAAEVASFKATLKAVAVKAMAQVLAKADLATAAHAKKAALAVVVGKAKAADKVAQAANPTHCAPALTPWASAVATVAVVAEAVDAIANPVAVAVGVLTRCAPALAVSNKLIL
jgi:hypothetical protein